MRNANTHYAPSHATVIAVIVTALILAFTLSGIAEGATVKTRADVVVDIIEAKPRWHEDPDEDSAMREARLGSLASAMVNIADEWTCQDMYRPDPCVKRFGGSSSQLVALMITAGYFESRYSARIHGGVCHKYECDHGWSRGVFQVKPHRHGGIVPFEIWEAINGTDEASNQAAATGAAIVLSANWSACHSKYGISGVYKAYAKGRCTAGYAVRFRVTSYKRSLAAYRRGVRGLAGD